MARGTAQYLLHEDTRATTLVVYGSWGSGKVGLQLGCGLGLCRL